MKIPDSIVALATLTLSATTLLHMFSSNKAAPWQYYIGVVICPLFAVPPTPTPSLLPGKCKCGASDPSQQTRPWRWDKSSHRDRAGTPCLGIRCGRSTTWMPFFLPFTASVFWRIIFQPNVHMDAHSGRAKGIPYGPLTCALSSFWWRSYWSVTSRSVSSLDVCLTSNGSTESKHKPCSGPFQAFSFHDSNC